MSTIPKFETVADKVAITPLRRYSHPTVEVSNTLVPANVTLPQPPGHELYWRLNSVTLLDDFDGLFDRQNEVTVIAITVDSNSADPIQFNLPTPFVGIRKNHRLPIGDSGLGMYHSTPASFPKYIGLNLLIIEDDKDIRDVGAAIRHVRETPEYRSILNTAQTLATAANPAYGTFITIGDAVAGLTARILEQNKDDIVAYFAATYTLAFDNLGVGKHTFHQADRALVQYEILAKT